MQDEKMQQKLVYKKFYYIHEITLTSDRWEGVDSIHQFPEEARQYSTLVG